MQTITELVIEKTDSGVFTREQAAFWVENHGAKLDALLKRAIANHEIVRIHKGLYCLPIRFLKKNINPLELAQRIHGPSYISLESALSYYGWIPEAVHAVTSITQSRSRTFTTPLGVFSYTRIPQNRFLSGVRRFELDGGDAFFMATPIKALADYVYVHRCEWVSSEPVVNSLRVDTECFVDIRADLFDEIIPSYRSGRVRRFLNGLRKELRL